MDTFSSRHPVSVIRPSKEQVRRWMEDRPTLHFCQNQRVFEPIRAKNQISIDGLAGTCKPSSTMSLRPFGLVEKILHYGK